MWRWKNIFLEHEEKERAHSAQVRTAVAGRRGEDAKFWENELCVFDIRGSKAGALVIKWKLI